jgi:tetratricopeptide (TPR) repeat protein
MCLGLVLLFLLLISGQDVDLQSLYTRSQTLVQQGDLEGAEAIYQTLQESLPNVIALYTNRAALLERMQKYQQAVHVLDQAIETFPDETEPYNRQCTIFLQLVQLSRTKEAFTVQTSPQFMYQKIRSTCLKAANLDQNSAEAQGNAGALFTLWGEFKEAIPFYKNALKNIKKSDVSSRVRMMGNMANALSRGGEYQSAQMVGKKAVQESDKLGGSSYVYGLLGTILSTSSRGKKQIEAIEISRKQLSLFAKSLQHPDEKGCPASYKSHWSVLTNWDDLINDESSENHNAKDGSYAKRKMEQVTILNPHRALVHQFGSARLSHVIKAEAETDMLKLVDLESYPFQYVEPKIYLIQLEEIYQSGASGILHHNCKIFTGGHAENSRHSEILSPVPDRFGKRGENVINFVEPVASIVQLNLGNYYHWLCEGMGRFLLLLRHYLKFNMNVKLLIPIDVVPKFQELIKILAADGKNKGSINEDIDANILKNVLHYDYTKGRHFFKSLVFADWQVPSPSEDTLGTLAEDAWSTYYPPQETLVELRDRFYSALKSKFPSDLPLSSKLNRKPKILYLSRGDTSTRNIANEHELVGALADAFGSDQVTEFRATGRSLLEQAREFSLHNIVVAAHGAGISNMLFSPPGNDTHLVMFPMNPHVDHTFAHLSAALGHHHWLVQNVGSYYYGNYGTLSRSQIAEVVRVVGLAIEEFNKNDS